ncbi:hypothetical protein D1007_42643 [Hordeum vulgare]|nr:hypothetical protein D1007_42643 [Hordeum vulgare]
MESHIFQALCDHLRSRELLRNSKGVSVEEQLGMFMYMLSRNASYQARFTKDQVQDKEAQLKKHYKNIKSIVNRSGISWNDVACVINTTPEKWEEIIAEDSKLKMYEGKSFPLYEAMGVLYEGHIAQGRHCLTSRKPPTITKSGSNFGAKEKMVASSSKRNTRDRSDDSMRTPSIIDINDIPAWDDVDGDAERENTARDEEEFGSEDADGDHPQISESSAKGRRPKKQKSATYVQRLEDSMMAYVNFKKEQATKKERVSQQGKQPSITECLEILNDMEDVPDEVKILASDVFKDAANREIFLGYNSRLRGMWLKKEVDKISPQPPTSSIPLQLGFHLAIFLQSIWCFDHRYLLYREDDIVGTLHE